MLVSYSQIHQPLCCGVRTTSLIKKRVVPGNTVMQCLAYSMTWESKKLALCQSVLSEVTLPLIYQHLKRKLFWILWKTLHNSGLTCYVDNKPSLHHFALFSNSAEGLQDLLSAYNHVSKEIGLQINTSKTEAMRITCCSSRFSSKQCQASTSRSFQIFGWLCFQRLYDEWGNPCKNTKCLLCLWPS